LRRPCSAGHNFARSGSMLAAATAAQRFMPCALSRHLP
jgi:hypothetical protein